MVCANMVMTTRRYLLIVANFKTIAKLGFFIESCHVQHEQACFFAAKLLDK